MKKKSAQTKIQFIITGGTIDGFYQPATETSEPNPETVIPHYIEDVIKPHFAPVFKVISLLDSADMTDSVRKKILAAVKKAKSDYVIITHGTSTMDKTAAFLKKNLKNPDKTVILTGAMIPLKDFAQSDGGFNLGFAIGAAPTLRPGVYIAMNGKIFKAGTARKNVKAARFEDI